MPNDELKNLRAQVRKRRNAVTAKENRIKRNTGVDIRGTAQDPRRPLSVVDRYNRIQLLSYLRELDSFMSRNNGFVQGASGVLPKQEWIAYKKLEQKYNRIGAAHFEDIADIFIDLSGMTVRERERLMEPDSKRAQGDIRHKPFSPLNRDSKNIKSPEALRKLKESLEKKVMPDYLPKQIASARKQLAAMLTGEGLSGLLKQANALSDNQFNVLWNYTGFAGAVSAVYGSGAKRGKNFSADSDIYSSSVVESFSNDVREFFAWAKSIKFAEKSPKRPPQNIVKTVPYTVTGYIERD